jgi:hypothetical protein
MAHTGSLGGFGCPIVQVRDLGSGGYQEECIDTLKRALQRRGVSEVPGEYLNPIAEAEAGLGFVAYEHARSIAESKQRIDNSGADISGGACNEIRHDCLLK